MIETLTLPETMGTHAGFIAQATLRSVMAIGVPVAVAFGSLVTVGSEVTRARMMEAKGRLFGYWMLSLVITGAFLPESLVLGSLSQSSSGGDIVSAVASQHGGAIQTAQQLASSRGLSAHTAAVPPLVYHLVQGVSGKWLIAGQMVHQAATKPGTTIYPMALFSGYRLPNDVVVRIQAWTDKCILPAQAKLSALSEAYDFEALRPIPGSALWSVMSSMRAPLGQGVLNLVIPLVGCTTEGGNIHSRALSAINSQTTPAGTTYGALWSEHLGISETDAAHYFVEREVEAATGSNLPPSGLIGKYVGLQVLRSTMGAGTTLLRTFNPKAALLDLGARFGEGTVGQVLDRLSSVVGIAIFFSTYFPLFLAVGQSVVLSMLPVAVLWSLASPGHQIRPLGIWFASLVVVYSGPMIYGLIELMSTIYAGNNISFSTSTVPQWAGAHMGLLLIQASGPVIFLLIASMVTLSGYGISRLSRSI